MPDFSAHLAGIEYLPERHLDKDLFSTLQTNEYIRKGLNVMLIGATGCGKTYIACALASNACRNEYASRYFRLSEFFSVMEAARLQGIYDDTVNRFRKIPLMIFDDFLLLPTSPVHATGSADPVACTGRGSLINRSLLPGLPGGLA